MLGVSLNSRKRCATQRVTVVALALALSMLGLVSVASAATFNPGLVISDDNMRADDCMSAAAIQAFLVRENSLLATRSFARHDHGGSAPASVIIYEAARAYHISPKVLLVMLQKEQSLITRSEGSLVTGYLSTLDWAMGMGCPDSGVRYEKYRGFGNQLWYAAQRLNGYGEDGLIVARFAKSGQWYKPVHAINVATYKLYVYNPSIGAAPPYPTNDTPDSGRLSGNANFWVIYWRYFGNPLTNPAVRTVYAIQSRSNGSFIYTMSPAEKHRLSRSTKSYTYRGSLISVNTSGGVNPVRVYKIQNRKTGVYTYTVSERAKRRLLAQRKKYLYRGVAFMATGDRAGRPVYRFVSRKNGADVFIVTSAQKRTYQSRTNRKKYRYAGAAFYVMP